MRIGEAQITDDLTLVPYPSHDGSIAYLSVAARGSDWSTAWLTRRDLEELRDAIDEVLS